MTDNAQFLPDGELLAPFTKLAQRAHNKLQQQAVVAAVE